MLAGEIPVDFRVVAGEIPVVAEPQWWVVAEEEIHHLVAAFDFRVVLEVGGTPVAEASADPAAVDPVAA